jgi:lysophospholipase L1-like esterase
MTGPAPLLRNLALAAVSTAVALGLLELAARALGPREPTGKLSAYMQDDPVLGWRHRPGAHAVFALRECDVDVKINSHGLRDPERDPNVQNAVRILALGDSFVEAFSVPAMRGVTRLLEESLDRAIPGPVVVVNGGTAGYSTDQEVLFFESEAAKVDPHVVVLFFFFNDVMGNLSDVMGGAFKPYFAIDADGLVLKNVPVPAQPIRTAHAPAPPPEEGSALLRLCGERLKNGAPRAYNRLARFGLWEPLRPRPTRDDFKVYRRHRSPDVESAWTVTARLLERLARGVEARGARLLVVYVPSRIEVTERDWQLTCLRYGWDETNASRFRVVERLADIARDVGFPLLDLSPALRAADWGVLGGPYYPTDLHWNALGHEVAAREVERWLRREAWVP